MKSLLTGYTTPITAPHAKECGKCAKMCKNQRGCLIGQFVLVINTERQGTQYKPITYMAVQGKLSFMGDSELYIFYKQCVDYKGAFSKRYFGGFKQK